MYDIDSANQIIKTKSMLQYLMVNICSHYLANLTKG